MVLRVLANLPRLESLRFEIKFQKCDQHCPLFIPFSCPDHHEYEDPTEVLSNLHIPTLQDFKIEARMVHSPTVARFLQRHASSLRTIKLRIDDADEPIKSLLREDDVPGPSNWPLKRAPCPGLQLSLPLLENLSAPVPYWEILDPNACPMLMYATLLKSPTLSWMPVYPLRYCRRVHALSFQIPATVKATETCLHFVRKLAIYDMRIEYFACRDDASELVWHSQHGVVVDH